jgi:c-di-GMP-binding flagellar brake protein YcgR
LQLQNEPLNRTRLKSERRRHRRSLYSVPIKLHCLMPGGVLTSRGISLDISEGGIGALVQSELMVGEAVEIDLQLPQCALCTVAIVRHTARARSGFEFLGLTPEERRQIARVMGVS